jgi:hypothetical protein
MTTTTPVRNGHSSTQPTPSLPTSFLPTLPKSRTSLSPLIPQELSRHIHRLRDLYIPPIHGGIYTASPSGHSSRDTNKRRQEPTAAVAGLGLDITRSIAREAEGPRASEHYDDDTAEEDEEEDSNPEDDEAPQLHLDPFERDWAEKWLNGIVRRAQGWIEEHPDAEEEGYREGDWDYKEMEAMLRESTAVLAIMAGTSGAFHYV